MPEIQAMSFCCRDIGLNCSYEINGSTSQELMKQFIDHAETAHKMQVLPADVIFKVQNAIKK
jgi:predicted small metal-binding protein